MMCVVGSRGRCMCVLCVCVYVKRDKAGEGVYRCNAQLICQRDGVMVPV